MNPFNNIELILLTASDDRREKDKLKKWLINILQPIINQQFMNVPKLAVYMIVKEDEGFSDRYSTAFEPYR